MNEKVDIRIKKTKRSLIKAFIELANEKNINLISVNEIVKKAELNRGTFYLHYENKEDFIKSISNEILEEFVVWIRRAQKINSIKSDRFNINKPKDTLYEMFSFVGENHKFFSIMLGENGSTVFRDKMQEYIKNKVYKELIPSINLEGECVVDKDILFEFTSSSCMGLILYWLNNERKESAEYMAEELTKISVLGPIRALGIIK